MQLYKLKDRRGAEMILAPTHEEEITRLIGADTKSTRGLPVRVYQIGAWLRAARPLTPSAQVP